MKKIFLKNTRISGFARKTTLGIVLTAMGMTFHACNNEDEKPVPTPSVETMSAKWTMPNGSQWESFEFFESQTYIATKRSGASAAMPRTAMPMAASDAVIVYGKYTINGGDITLDGLGTLKVENMTSDKAEFSFTPTDEAAAKYSVTVEVKITVTKTDPSPAPSLDYVIGDSATWVCQEQQMDIINRSSTDTMVIIHTRIEHGDNYYYGWVRHVVDTGIAMSYSVLSSNSHYNCHIANDNNVECWHRIPEYYLDSMYSDSVLRGTWSRSTNNIVDSVITDITTTLRFTQNAVTLSVQHSNPYRYESYSGSYMYPYENTAGRMSVKFYDQNWHYMGNVTDNNMLLKRHDLNNVPDNTSMQRFVRRR